MNHLLIALTLLVIYAMRGFLGVRWVGKDRPFGLQDHQTWRVNVKSDVYGCIGQHNCTFLSSNSRGGRSQWPRGLRRRSTAARLLRSWVQIPLVAWMFVCCECCQVKVFATDWSLVQGSPTDCGASLCVIKKPRTRGGYNLLEGCKNTKPQWVVAPIEKKNSRDAENVSIRDRDVLHDARCARGHVH